MTHAISSLKDNSSRSKGEGRRGEGKLANSINETKNTEPQHVDIAGGIFLLVEFSVVVFRCCSDGENVLTSYAYQMVFRFRCTVVAVVLVV